VARVGEQRQGVGPEAGDRLHDHEGRGEREHHRQAAQVRLSEILSRGVWGRGAGVLVPAVVGVPVVVRVLVLAYHFGRRALPGD
jgi:hypothetical protein